MNIYQNIRTPKRKKKLYVQTNNIKTYTFKNSIIYIFLVCVNKIGDWIKIKHKDKKLLAKSIRMTIDAQAVKRGNREGLITRDKL